LLVGSAVPIVIGKLEYPVGTDDGVVNELGTSVVEEVGPDDVTDDGVTEATLLGLFVAPGIVCPDNVGVLLPIEVGH